MQKFIGTKIIHAEPAVAPAGVHQSIEGDEGYKVVYEDGYQSWSPKEIFEDAYRPCDAMPFGLAIEAMKKGHRVARAGWNGKNMFVYFVAGSTVPVEDLRGACADAHEASNNTAPVQDICGHVDMLTADGSIVVGWLASQTDMLSDDWMIID